MFLDIAFILSYCIIAGFGGYVALGKWKKAKCNREKMGWVVSIAMSVAILILILGISLLIDWSFFFQK